jgi:hypothetical protein
MWCHAVCRSARSAVRVTPLLVLPTFVLGCGASHTGGARSTSEAPRATQQYLAAARADCEAARRRVASIPRPSGGAFASQGNIAYERRLLSIARRTLSRVQEMPVPLSLADIREALARETRGERLIEQEIDAQQRGERARYTQLTNAAKAVTHPADEILRRHGLASCVGG